VNIIISIVLAILLIGVFPIWPHSIRWGYYPSSGLGLLLTVLLIYLLIRRG
jgi:hypothetical protein